MTAEPIEFCNLCEHQVVLCIPGSKPDCGVFKDFQGQAEEPTGKLIPDTTAVITNTGVMNRLQGEIVDVDQGQVMAKVIIKVGDNYLSSIIPVEDFINSGKSLGDKTNLAIRSFDVKLMV